MKKIITAIALAVTSLTAAAAEPAPSIQEEVRRFACADVSTFSNDACLASMFSEVQRTQKAFLEKPSMKNAIAFDFALSAFNGALAVAPRTSVLADLETQYKALLKELADAEGKTLPRYTRSK